MRVISCNCLRLGRYDEALWCLEEGVASLEDIDKAACDLAMPIGPLALRDMNGADIGLAVAKFNFQEETASVSNRLPLKKW